MLHEQQELNRVAGSMGHGTFKAAKSPPQRGMMETQLRTEIGQKVTFFKGLAPVVLITAVLAAYLCTVCPTVYLGDSGEFIASAFCLGNPHNSGYPLYALLGKLFSLIPLGHVAARVNMMSVFFGLMTVYLVYGLILRITASEVSAFAGALLLAFTPVLWSQTVSAEVYTLHSFFVVLLIRLLWWWDEDRRFYRLAIFVFVTGISFGNHMQTVMLAPAVLFLILSADYKSLANARNFFFLSILFVFALSLYLYLPIRTDAGAAIHWGDPNTLDRFLAHVTARSHREGYVMTKEASQYLSRTGEALLMVGAQFGVALVFALVGWFRLGAVRWRIFFLTVIVFDFIYTVFLNIISLEITAFNFSTCISLSVLSGIGIAYILKAARQHASVSKTTYGTLRGAACVLPVIPLIFNFQLCDQSRNYTAYEHALNIFRTVERRGILFLDGDNNLFPVTYGRLVERMGEDVTLYDRYDLLFKLPFPDNLQGEFYGDWKDLKPIAERRIVEKARHGVFLAAYDPSTLPMAEGEVLLPYGILYRVFRDEESYDPQDVRQIWDYYATEAFYDQYQRDYMTREVSAFFHFSLGKFFFMAGEPMQGLEQMRAASRMGYNDTMIHSDIGLFLIDQGVLDEARKELAQASIYNEDPAGINNNWGYYYYKIGNYDEAETAYRKAIALRPKNFRYYNNLGLALYYGQKKDQAAAAFQTSLSISKNQPKLIKFMEQQGITP